VHLKVVTPPADSDESKEFYERMEKELPFNPRSNI
jgi:curved DNA-binding protein